MHELQGSLRSENTPLTTPEIVNMQVFVKY